MASAEEIRSLREKVTTRIQSLREFEDVIKQPLDETQETFNELRRRLPQDLSGEGLLKWTDLRAEDQQAFRDQLRTIDDRLDVLEFPARKCTQTEKRLLLIYALFMPVALFVPIFYCICMRAVTVPETDEQAANGSAANDSAANDIGASAQPAARNGDNNGQPGPGNPHAQAAPTDAGHQEPQPGSEADNETPDAQPARDGAGNQPGGPAGPPADMPSTADDPGQTNGENLDGDDADLERRGIHPAYTFLLILCVGAIGGSLRMTGSAIYYFGKRKFYRSWLPYYYYAPLEGALLAFLVCLLVLSGYLRPNSGNSDTQLVSAPSLYALAAFTGLFAKNVLRKLKDVTDSVFGAASETDAA